MPTNLENPEMATGLEKVDLLPNYQEGQWERMLKPPDTCTHGPCQWGSA